MYDAVDIFPIHFSTSLTRLQYPEANFKYWANDPDIKVFVLFTNSQSKIYYSKKPLTEQNMNNILLVGKECKKFKYLCPRKINFTKVANRFKSDPCDEGKKNADVRLGFKLKNTYLVKAYFTFGLRHVEPGSAHVIQTLNVPLLIYLYPKRLGNLCREEERVFPFEDLHVYGLSILPQNGVYRIPPGTRYLLMSTQKNFFSFDIVPESMEMPFDFSDPVKKRITRLPGMYDRPPKTPHIEQVQEDDVEESLSFPQQQQQQQQQQEQDCFYEFFQTEPFKPAVGAQDSSNQQLIVYNAAVSNDDATVNDIQQNFTYWIVPNQPVLEKSVVPVSVEFANTYQMLKNKKIEEDPCMKIPRANDDDPLVQPLDLRIFKAGLDTMDCLADNSSTTNNCVDESMEGETIYDIENNDADPQSAASIEANDDCFAVIDLDNLPMGDDKEADSIISELLSPYVE